MPGAGGDVAKEANTWFIISLVGIFCCSGWCFFLPAIGAFMAYQGKTLAEQGNTAEAAGKIKTAKILTIVAAVIWTLLIIAYVILMLTGTVASMF